MSSGPFVSLPSLRMASCADAAPPDAHTTTTKRSAVMQRGRSDGVRGIGGAYARHPAGRNGSKCLRRGECSVVVAAEQQDHQAEGFRRDLRWELHLERGLLAVGHRLRVGHLAVDVLAG